jgi:hypothetical protein
MMTTRDEHRTSLPATDTTTHLFTTSNGDMKTVEMKPATSDAMT